MEKTKSNKSNTNTINFKDVPDFKPNMSPSACIRSGIFGGIYFNPEGGRVGILNRKINIDHKEFPKSWFKGLKEEMYLSKKYNKLINKYKVVAGTNQAFWEEKGWIEKQDPRGWFQWYCRFYKGRRSYDDVRQIKRWQGICGENGRWRKNLINKIKNGKDSPVIRQTLLHWAFEL